MYIFVPQTFSTYSRERSGSASLAPRMSFIGTAPCSSAISVRRRIHETSPISTL